MAEEWKKLNKKGIILTLIMSIELHQESNLYRRTLLALSSQREVLHAEIRNSQDGEPSQFHLQWPIRSTLTTCLSSVSALFINLQRRFQSPRSLRRPAGIPFLGLELRSEEEQEKTLPFEGYIIVERRDGSTTPFHLHELTKAGYGSTLRSTVQGDPPDISQVYINTPYFSACFDGPNTVRRQRRGAMTGLENLADEIAPVHSQTAVITVDRMEWPRIQNGLNNLWFNLPKLDRLEQ